MNKGFIKIHRKMTEWEWYSDNNTFRVFLHLLLKANHKNTKFRGKSVCAGSLIIGRKSLSSEIGISEQQIRTSLNKLKSTSEITIKTTNKFSICTIVKWCDYQAIQPASNQQSNQQVTNNQPTSNQQVTTSKEIKKLRSKEYKQNRADALDYSSWPSMPNNQTMIDWLAMRKRLKANVTQTVINRLAKKLHSAVSEGFTVDDCIAECVERNWKGFDVEWIKGTNQADGKIDYMDGVLNA